MAEFDRSSKWLIERHGDAILRLAGVRDVVGYRALQAELVQTGQLPDGLLEVQLAGSTEPALFVVEIATYPERRLLDQLIRDTLLVYLNRRVVPEVLALVLHPKGKLRIADTFSVESPQGWTTLQVRWRVVELWVLPAQELLAMGDPGLVPWVPLTRFEGRPETLLYRCRDVIDRVESPEERRDLLAVTQVLARLRYNDPELLKILGGHTAMIESPLLDEIRAEAEVDVIVKVLQIRLGSVPPNVQAALRSIQDRKRLDVLLEDAIRAETIQEFMSQLQSR